MHELRLVGVHEDGRHVLLADPAGQQYRLPLDEALRAAALRDRPRLGQLQIEIEGGLRPAEVQALIRRGLSAEEVAGRAGWSVEKVRRYEGPVLAEREYIAGLAPQRTPLGAGAAPSDRSGTGSGPAARPRRRAGAPLVGLRAGRRRLWMVTADLPRRRPGAVRDWVLTTSGAASAPATTRPAGSARTRRVGTDPRTSRRHVEQPAEHRLRRRGRGWCRAGARRHGHRASPSTSWPRCASTAPGDGGGVGEPVPHPR